MLESEGFYAELCEGEHTVPCQAQEQALTVVYTWGAVAQTSFAIVTGLIIHELGLRALLAIGCVLEAAGLYLLLCLNSPGESICSAHRTLCLRVSVSLCLCVSVSLCLSVSLSLSLCLSVSLSLCLSVSLSLCLSVSLSLCLSLSLSLCLCLCLSLSLSLSLLPTSQASNRESICRRKMWLARVHCRMSLSTPSFLGFCQAMRHLCGWQNVRCMHRCQVRLALQCIADNNAHNGFKLKETFAAHVLSQQMIGMNMWTKTVIFSTTIRKQTNRRTSTRVTTIIDGCITH
eukprot:SAG31_NODE_1983_length_6741_cov_6.836194_5_plen_288_part_00